MHGAHRQYCSDSRDPEVDQRAQQPEDDRRKHDCTQQPVRLLEDRGTFTGHYICGRSTDCSSDYPQQNGRIGGSIVFETLLHPNGDE